MSSLDWGDVPTWVASVFGGGAFAGALLLLRIESKRDDRKTESEARLQASHVTAWITSSTERDGLTLNLLNASAACVFEVYALFEAFDEVLGYDFCDVLRPGSPPRQIPVPVSAMDRYSELLPMFDDRWENIRPALTLRDSSNKYWKRNKNGLLSAPRPGELIPELKVRAWHARDREERRRQTLESHAHGDGESSSANGE